MARDDPPARGAPRGVLGLRAALDRPLGHRRADGGPAGHRTPDDYAERVRRNRRVPPQSGRDGCPRRPDHRGPVRTRDPGGARPRDPRRGVRLPEAGDRRAAAVTGSVRGSRGVPAADGGRAPDRRRRADARHRRPHPHRMDAKTLHHRGRCRRLPAADLQQFRTEPLHAQGVGRPTRGGAVPGERDRPRVSSGSGRTATSWSAGAPPAWWRPTSRAPRRPAGWTRPTRGGSSSSEGQASATSFCSRSSPSLGEWCGWDFGSAAAVGRRQFPV